MYSYPERREYYTKENGVEPFHPNHWGWFSESKNTNYFKSKLQLSNDNEDFINWYKNHLLITNFLQNKNIPYIWNGIFINNEYDDGFRFDGDYNIPYNNHATPNENKDYANKLFNFIKKK